MEVLKKARELIGAIAINPQTTSLETRAVVIISALLAEVEKLEIILSVSCKEQRAEGPYEAYTGPCPEIIKALSESKNARNKAAREAILVIREGIRPEITKHDASQRLIKHFGLED